MAASGTLIARAAFVGDLPVLGLASAIAMAALALVTWHHGHLIYRERRGAGRSPPLQAVEFRLLTAATVVIAAIAILVTIAV